MPKKGGPLKRPAVWEVELPTLDYGTIALGAGLKSPSGLELCTT